ncbi:glycosyl transferase family 14 [Planoprotostelium fungivorum]|uniref:protein xylosyltransferase n=1 Tax=Planoprotostelium fungivorum TaxID=1890364 RepID=A0A2P6NG94_9EUKA|nr:glycosyl transferase family 14 [Planoprotostelium fungivorum]
MPSRGRKRQLFAKWKYLSLVVLLWITSNWTHAGPPYRGEIFDLFNAGEVLVPFVPSEVVMADHSNVSLAYLITVHNRETVTSMSELINAVYHPKDYIFIHADAHSIKDSGVDIIREHYENIPNIIVLEDRVPGKWGDFALVQMYLNLIKAAHQPDYKWNYAIALDGSAYPIKMKHLRSFMAGQHENMCFVDKEWYPCRDTTPTGRDKCSRTPARCLNSRCTTHTLSPDNAPIASSTQWFVLSRPFITWLLQPEVLVPWTKFFRPTWIPDEQFWTTLFYNSPFREHRLDFEFTVVDWREKCLLWENPRPGGSPCYLGVTDLTTVLNVEGFFVRKMWSKEPLKRLIDFHGEQVKHMYDLHHLAAEALQSVKVSHKKGMRNIPDHVPSSDVICWQLHHVAIEKVEEGDLYTNKPCYTITPLDDDETFHISDRIGMRLSTDENGKIIMQPPSNDDDQKWKMKQISPLPSQHVGKAPVFTYEITQVKSGMLLTCEKCGVQGEEERHVSKFGEGSFVQRWRVLPVVPWYPLLEIVCCCVHRGPLSAHFFSQIRKVETYLTYSEDLRSVRISLSIINELWKFKCTVYRYDLAYDLAKLAG